MLWPQNTWESYCHLRSCFICTFAALTWGKAEGREGRGEFPSAPSFTGLKYYEGVGRTPIAGLPAMDSGLIFPSAAALCCKPRSPAILHLLPGLYCLGQANTFWRGHVTSGKPQYLHMQKGTGEETCAGQGCSPRAMALGSWPSRQAQACRCAMAALETLLKGRR